MPARGHANAGRASKRKSPRGFDPLASLRNKEPRGINSAHGARRVISLNLDRRDSGWRGLMRAAEWRTRNRDSVINLWQVYRAPRRPPIGVPSIDHDSASRRPIFQARFAQSSFIELAREEDGDASCSVATGGTGWRNQRTYRNVEGSRRGPRDGIDLMAEHGGPFRK